MRAFRNTTPPAIAATTSISRTMKTTVAAHAPRGMSPETQPRSGPDPT
jgi:hypothetical protein